MRPRISESELVLPTLRLLAQQPDGFLTTSDLIELLTATLRPEGKDAEIARPARSDSRFSEKVRNLVSHRHGKESPFRLGLLEYDAARHGIRITRAARRWIKTDRGTLL